MNLKTYIFIFLFLLKKMYGVVYYLGKNGQDKNELCINETSPCKTLEYLVNHYNPKDGKMEIKFLDGSFEIPDFQFDCQNKLEKISFSKMKDVQSQSVFVKFHNFLLRNCDVEFDSFQVQAVKSTSKISIELPSNFVLINCNVSIKKLSFLEFQPMLLFIDSNLSMNDIYFVQDSKSEPNYVPLIQVTSTFNPPKHTLDINNINISMMNCPFLMSCTLNPTISNVHVMGHNSGFLSLIL